MTRWIVGGTLLAAGLAGAEEWRLGMPAPGFAGHSESMVVVLGVDEVPEWLRDGARRLEDHGVAVVPDPSAAGKASLVDESGVVRRVGLIPATGEELLDFITEWGEGRAIFRYRCARCHGQDGMDTSYPYIRQLAGIGSRLTRQQIREKLRPAVVGQTVYVRGEQFSRKHFEALITFVNGL